MPSLILGTAGHIDHGKTALVKALTGTDTDRLKEEKERGITVDLGFAELSAPGDVHFGVVDVPGHEGFIKNMLAGATGMDLVLLVVAADEGIMPQTREHLAIAELLGVPRLVVAVTKSDLVDSEWLELVVEEIQEALAGTPFAGSPVLPVSSATGAGLEELLGTLGTLGSEALEKDWQDVARLPVDRVFTIRGAGTIVTGTLWSGEMRVGDRVRISPGDQDARIRSLQLHGQAVEKARAGARVAVGLTGSGVSHQNIHRGQTILTGEGWAPSWMLDCWLRILPESTWQVEQGQRVRVHLGTAEVLARAVLLETETLSPGDEGWVQFRLEQPVLARVRDRFVVRSYSPVTTIAGGVVADVLPEKRRSLRPGASERLSGRISADPRRALTALLDTARWRGVATSSLPQLLGLSSRSADEAIRNMVADGGCLRVEDRLFSARIAGEAESRTLSTLARYHEAEPLRPGMPLEELRQSLPRESDPALVEATLRRLVDDGSIEADRGRARLAGFTPSLSDEQAATWSRIGKALKEAGLAAPGLAELTAITAAPPEEVLALLRLMESQGEVLALEGGLFFHPPAVTEAGRLVVGKLGGATGLGPADFRDLFGVSRKYLLPLLRHLDTVGITTRVGEDRSVARSLPPEWGT